MFIWLILGYLVASVVTFLLVYSSYIVAAKADQVHEQKMATYAIRRQSPTHLYMPTENFSPSL